MMVVQTNNSMNDNKTIQRLGILNVIFWYIAAIVMFDITTVWWHFFGYIVQLILCLQDHQFLLNFCNSSSSIGLTVRRLNGHASTKLCNNI